MELADQNPRAMNSQDPFLSLARKTPSRPGTVGSRASSADTWHTPESSSSSPPRPRDEGAWEFEQLAQATPRPLSKGVMNGPEPADVDRNGARMTACEVEDEPRGSSVWNELEELKSRIQKLEVTGRLPTPSDSSTSQEPRLTPRFATFAARGGVGGDEHAAEEAMEHVAERHPLLYSALAKAQRVLSGDAYSALEAAAHEAMALSSGQIERPARRRADGICRALTELCVALQMDARVRPMSSAGVPMGVARDEVSSRAGPLSEMGRLSGLGRRSTMESSRGPRQHLSPRRIAAAALTGRRGSVSRAYHRHHSSSDVESDYERPVSQYYESNALRPSNGSTYSPPRRLSRLSTMTTSVSERGQLDRYLGASGVRDSTQQRRVLREDSPFGR